MNFVLANTEERVFTSEGIDKQQLGLYLIRGDNVAIVGKIIYDNLLNCTVQSVSLRPRYGTDSKPDWPIIIGAVDENTELGMDFSSIKAQQLPPILHD